MFLKVYTDGGSRGNPGIAGAGVYILNPNTKEEYKFFKYLGRVTNNQAEYQAALLGLEKALDLGATSIELIADSQLLIRQARGEYKVKNSGLRIHFDKLKKLESKFDQVKYIHVKREYNKEADFLANKAMDTLSSDI